MSRSRATDITLYIPNLKGGGAERMMVNLSEGFTKRGVAVDLVLAEAKGPYLSHVPPGVNVIDLGSGGVMSSLPKLVRYLRKAKPRTLLVTLNHAAVAAILAARLAGTDTRVFARVSNMMFQGTVNSPRVKLLRAAVRHLFPRATGLIGVSKGVADDIGRFTGAPPEKIHAIYNPVVTDELKRQARAPLAHPWFDGGGPPVLLAAGRFTGQKDYPNMIRAFAQVRAERPVKLMILGEGQQRAELEALIAELGVEEDVSLPGFVDNPFMYMSRASLFVLASKWEGLPGVLIQAMACGCPVVSTDCPSGPREILEGGRYGPLVEVGDVQGLAAAISRTLESSVPSAELKARAADFSLESICDEYLNLLLPERVADRMPNAA